MKRLILADVKSLNIKGKSIGHYFTLAQNYIDLFGDYCQVKIAGGPIYKTRFDSNELMVLPYDFIPNKNWILNKWKVLMNCKYLFHNTFPEDIIVMQQSGLSTAILGIALFAKKRRNIYIIPYDTDALSSIVKKIIYLLAKSKIKGVLCPNKKIVNKYKKEGCIITDYIYTKDKIDTTLPFDKRKYDIAMIGRLNQDKGVIEAVKYLAGTKYKILIAGKGDDELIENELKDICSNIGIAPNVELHIGYVSDSDYYAYIRNSKYVMLNYRGDYEDRSSGVVLDTLFNGTPVLGRKCNALKFIEKEYVGYLFDDIKNLDLDEILNKKKYEEFQEGIIRYIDKQKKQKNKIVDYLHLE